MVQNQSTPSEDGVVLNPSLRPPEDATDPPDAEELKDLVARLDSARISDSGGASYGS